MRSLLVDWLIGVHSQLKLVPETLFLCVNLVDRFLSLRNVSVSKLQLVGITSLLISSKYEEVICPSIETFVLLDKSINEEEIRKAERYMLHVLDYKIEYPSPLGFLRRCSKANNYEIQTRTLAKYILELTLLYESFLPYPGSIRATSAMSLARKILQIDDMDGLLWMYSGYNEEMVSSCIGNMVRMLCEPIPFDNILKKYMSPKMLKVSQFVKDYSEKHLSKK
jgi:G2/mitotic-specific cyclin 1/2